MEGIRVIKYLVLVLLAASSFSSASAGTRAPATDQYFVLDHDRIRTEEHGYKHMKWVLGLRAGTYRLVAEDDYGFYFEGEGDCTLMLLGPDAERYIQTGEITPYEERKKRVLPNATGGYGGIFLPKPNSKRESMLYWKLHVDENPDSPISGLVVDAIIYYVNHSTAHHYLGKNIEFLGDLNISSGKPPDSSQNGRPAKSP
jgi:hypothetical protein